MRSPCKLWLLAVLIFPRSSFSQSTAATVEDAFGIVVPDPSEISIPKSLADVIPFACHESNALITDQLAEIKRLQSKQIPVTHDLAGYFYAVVRGRKILGCPNPNPFNSTQIINTTSSSARHKLKMRSDGGSSEEAQIIEELCKPARALKEEVMEMIDVMKQFEMPTPDFLAGWWSVTRDAEQYLNCEVEHADIGTVDKSEGSS